MRAFVPMVLLFVACPAPTKPPEEGARGGAIRLIAGSIDGPGNQDGPRASARFGLPTGIARLPDGALLVADRSNSTIRRIGTDGVVTTFAGKSGEEGTVDGPLASARFRSPAALAVAPDGTVFVTDASALVVRRITPQGEVQTIAGQDLQEGAVDGAGPTARFRAPEGIALRADGSLLVADSGAHTIRRIGADGVVTTLAGAADQPGAADGTMTVARFNGLRGLAVATDGTIAVADTDANTIRLIDPSGNVETLAGNATAGQEYLDAIGDTARFAGPRGVAFMPNGDLLVGDSQNDRIRRVTRDGIVTTYASAGNGQADGTRAEARFQFPWGLLLEGDALLVCDAGNSTVRRIAAATVETFAGTPTRFGTTDGPAQTARFFLPGSAVLRDDGTLVVTDMQNHTLRQVSADGTTSTWIGIAGTAGSVDGTRTEAGFDTPAGIVTDGAGGYFVAEQGSHLIRRVAADGSVTTYAGGPSRGGDHADGALLDARFAAPGGLARDAAGNLFVADSRNHRIRRIGTDGQVTTVAGDGLPGANDGEGSIARFHFPQAVVVDTDGTLYVADTMNHLLRKIAFEGGLAIVTTLAGTLPFDGEPISGSADGTGYGASFNTPNALAWDADGTLVVADTNNNLLRRVTKAGVVTTVAGTRGSVGVRTGALPGSLFEPRGLVALGERRFAVTFATGLLEVTLQ